MLKLKRYPNRSPYWYIRGTVAGVRIFESAETVERATAEEIRIRRETEILRSVKLGEQAPASFATAVATYLAAGKPGDYLTPLLDHFVETPISQIGQAEIDAAANALYPEAKASTLNRQVYGRMIAVLRAAKRANLPGSSTPMIEMRREEKPIIKPATDDYLDKLLPHCRPNLRSLLVFMTYTGLRTGPALRVVKDDIQDGYVVVGKEKNGDPRMTPLPAGWAYPEGGWGYETSQGVCKAIRSACKRAGVPYLKAHAIGRHGFAARFLKHGGSIKRLKEAGGWKKLAVVDETYGHLERTDVHDFMRGLSKKRAKSVQNNGQKGGDNAE